MRTCTGGWSSARDTSCTRAAIAISSVQAYACWSGSRTTTRQSRFTRELALLLRQLRITGEVHESLQNHASDEGHAVAA